MQPAVYEPRVTFEDVIATVSGLTANEAEAAEVINHMLRWEYISFANTSAPEEIEKLLS